MQGHKILLGESMSRAITENSIKKLSDSCLVFLMAKVRLLSNLLELLSSQFLMPLTCFGCVAFTGSSFEVHSVLHPQQLMERLWKHYESCSGAGYVLTVLKWKSAGVGSCKQSCVYKIHFLATPLNWEQLILTKQKQTGKRHGPERHSQPDLSNNCVYLLTLFYSINNYWS